MSHLIEHVYDPGALLEECYRILKPGGRVVIVTPNTQSVGHRMFGKYWRGLEPPRHIYLFSIASLKRLGSKAGFDILSARTTIRGAHWAYRDSRRIKAAAAGGSTSRFGDAVVPYLLQYVECMVLRVSPTAGSEMAVILRRR
jgi:SAM-dependent methyltransferase